MRAGRRSVPRLGFLCTPHGAKPNQGIPSGQQWASWEGAAKWVYKYYTQQSQLARSCLAWSAMQLCNVGIMKGGILPLVITLYITQLTDTDVLSLRGLFHYWCEYGGTYKPSSIVPKPLS